ncbi:hypothetical protein LJC39_04055 [Parabacteroides sp. OttesenSCG-928-B22]|nr:hypothetical protein [Parabacteroides sp. OttesenSCG-928-B22]
MDKEELQGRYPKHIKHNGMRYYSEQEVIAGIKILVEKADSIEQKLAFCREHKFNHEAAALDNMRSLLGDMRSNQCIHFDLLGRVY